VAFSAILDKHDARRKDTVSAIIYQSKRATLYLGDCMKVLPTLAKGSADLLVTDPPYGVSYQSGYRTEKFESIEGDYSTDIALSALALVPSTLRDRRHVYVFGFTAEQLKSVLKLAATADLIWDKEMLGMGNLSLPWASQHETLLFGVHVKSSHAVAANRGALSARMRKGSILRYPRKHAGQINNHPTEKPVALLSQLVESSSCVGDTVLDPFMGSGSTCVAAVLAGRKTVGIEIDPGYTATAVARVREAERIRGLIEKM
jgi:site-specific DNA-methyltransferase (adenine-specific)